ncbi:MAG: electron transfer flavoprotein subunit beta/FixA family protein [Actinomycetota bacterium]|jgi:electron transfer flavoprotein beta subunit|nr:electron transfer flavoprotein subunit beta/FixA family protein [Actinomycetota bacterium]
MKVVVCMKEVPAQAVPRRLDRNSYRLVRSVGSEINGADHDALEAALLIKDTGTECEIVVASVGPTTVVGSLQHALAMGADRAVVVSDEAVAGSDLIATSRVLSRLVARESPDLVLFGPQASDSSGSVLWAAVAERLGTPFVSNATRVKPVGGAVEATRQTEIGYEKVLVPQPCVISVSGAGQKPRYPSLKGMVAAKRKEVVVLSLADVGLSPTACGISGSMTRVLGMSPPPPRQKALMISDENTAAEQILAFLSSRRLL